MPEMPLMKANRKYIIRVVFLFCTVHILLFGGCVKQLKNSAKENAVKIKDDVPSAFTPIRDNVNYDIDRFCPDIKN